MSLLDKIFTRNAEPSERKMRRATKQVTQIHGDPAARVSALEKTAEWGNAEAARVLLRRFTVQVPQGSMDLEEKQLTMRLLAGIGRPAVAPILGYIRTEPEVTWPIQALRQILPADEYVAAMKNILEELATAYTRWSEAKAVLIRLLPDEAFPAMRETVAKYLEDEDDDIAIAAADYLARSGDEEIRERLLELFLAADARPRVRGRILELFCEREWLVKGFRKRVEETIAEPYYLTSKGTVKRRTLDR